ncbi:MAG: DNA alkylation repair protein [Clostridia bacterium]|nr:DNA alkylation repair protein [Clostridia bacterium]
MPTVDPATVIGVRTPHLRRLAKELYGTPVAEDFLQDLPHRYYEENNLHGFLLERIPEYVPCVEELNRFLPYIDNWATCDGLSPGAFKRHPAALPAQIRAWLDSDRVYTVRFGVCMLIKYYLDTHFSPDYPAWVAAIPGEDYYIRMVVAWYFATALAKQPETVLPYIEEKRLSVWTHNKTIQKALESYRITPEMKAYLREQKIR